MGEREGVEGGSLGLTSLNRSHSGGGQLVWGPIPMQPAASLPQTARGGKRQGARKRDSRKTERRLGGETEMGRERKKKSSHNGRRMLGPKASKVAMGEK